MNGIALKLLKQSGLQPYYEEQNVQIEKFTTLLVHDFLSDSPLNKVKVNGFQFLLNPIFF